MDYPLWTPEQINRWWDSHTKILQEEGMGNYTGWLEKAQKFQKDEASKLEELVNNSFKLKKEILHGNNQQLQNSFEDTTQTWVGRSLTFNDKLKECRKI